MFQKAPVPFFTNANGTQMFFTTKCFPKKWGQALCACVGPLAHPHFLEENIFIEKNFSVPFAFVKNGTAVFWDIWLTKIWICVCLSIFSLQKDWIRVMRTFIASKKVNPWLFCACVLLQKIAFVSKAFLHMKRKF